MGLHVSGEADFLSKLLFTNEAYETFIFSMYPQVLLQIFLPGKRFRAHVATERFLSRVPESVVLHLVPGAELEFATRALVAVVAVHQSVVFVERLPRAEHLFAVRTRVRPSLPPVHFREVLLFLFP